MTRITKNVNEFWTSHLIKRLEAQGYAVSAFSSVDELCDNGYLYSAKVNINPYRELGIHRTLVLSHQDAEMPKQLEQSDLMRFCAPYISQDFVSIMDLTGGGIGMGEFYFREDPVRVKNESEELPQKYHCTTEKIFFEKYGVGSERKSGEFIHDLIGYMNHLRGK